MGILALPFTPGEIMPFRRVTSNSDISYTSAKVEVNTKGARLLINAPSVPVIQSITLRRRLIQLDAARGGTWSQVS